MNGSITVHILPLQQAECDCPCTAHAPAMSWSHKAAPGRIGYSIGVVDDAEQGVAQRFDEAMRTATQLAGERKVDGWYTCDHTHFLLVAHHRSPIKTAVGGLASGEGGKECGRLAVRS